MSATWGPQTIDEGILLFAKNHKRFTKDELVKAVQQYTAAADWEIYPRLYRLQKKGRLVYAYDREQEVYEIIYMEGGR